MHVEQKREPFFSVVMPAYGVEKYLEKAVESICGQTFSDWELLIVEDGSPDATGALAEELRKADDRIRVLHHEKNKGLSEARNTGIDQAKGSYIWFMDPDDSVDRDLLEKAREALAANPAKLTIFGHIEEYYGENDQYKYSHAILPEEHCFRTKEEIQQHVIRLEQDTIYGYAWNKIYDLRYIREKGFRYETVRLIEDIVFNIEYCMDIDSMNILAFTPYHYAKRTQGSLTTKFVPDYYPLHRRRISMLYEQQRRWKNDTEEVCSVLGSLYGRYILSALERNCDRRAEMSRKDRQRFCREIFQDPLFARLIPGADARDSRALSLALKCMKKRSVLLCTLMGRGVHAIRACLPLVYSKVKSER